MSKHLVDSPPPCSEMPPFFDAAAVWSALTADEQAQLGRIALTLACALVGADDGDSMTSTALSRASRRAEAVLTAALADIYVAVTDVRPATPDLNQLGIRACRSCGCTDDHACAEGCSWAGPDLCSACAVPSELASA